MWILDESSDPGLRDSDVDLGSESSDPDFSELDVDVNLITALQSNSEAITSEALYDGSLVTTRQFHVTMASFAQRHNLSYTCQTDILKFVANTLTAPNTITSTARSLVRMFVQYEQQSVIHQCCGVCTCI